MVFELRSVVYKFNAFNIIDKLCIGGPDFVFLDPLFLLWGGEEKVQNNYCGLKQQLIDIRW